MNSGSLCIPLQIPIQCTLFILDFLIYATVLLGIAALRVKLTNYISSK